MKPITRKQAEDYFKQTDKRWSEIDEASKDIVITSFMIGHNVGALAGYDEGFEIAQAAERGIIAVNKKIDEYDQATQTPATDTSNSAGVPGPSELQNLICGGLRP